MKLASTPSVTSPAVIFSRLLLQNFPLRVTMCVSYVDCIYMTICCDEGFVVSE